MWRGDSPLSPLRSIFYLPYRRVSQTPSLESRLARSTFPASQIRTVQQRLVSLSLMFKEKFAVLRLGTSEIRSKTKPFLSQAAANFQTSSTLASEPPRNSSSLHTRSLTPASVPAQLNFFAAEIEEFLYLRISLQEDEYEILRN